MVTNNMRGYSKFIADWKNSKGVYAQLSLFFQKYS